MSEPAASAPHAPAPPATGASTASPEFDGRELIQFGQDDGHAVTVIGKMLVGFFFYSLIAMSLVAWWTRGGGGQTPDQPAQASHAEDSDD